MGYLRRYPSMFPEHVLHHPDCCFFIFICHQDSIMDGEEILKMPTTNLSKKLACFGNTYFLETSSPKRYPARLLDLSDAGIGLTLSTAITSNLLRSFAVRENFAVSSANK